MHGRVVPIGEGNVDYKQQHADIFRYKADENSFDEIVYELPDGVDDIEEPIGSTGRKSIDELGEARHNGLFLKAA